MAAEETAPATGWVGRFPVRARRLLVRAGIAALVTVNSIGLAVIAAAFLHADVGVDWTMFVIAGDRVFSGGLYDWPDDGLMVWRYSPAIAYLFAGLAPIGYLGWSALHIGALALLPRRLGLIALVSFPFWTDVYNGNTVTFVFVAAVLALRGSRVAGIVFLALLVLMPRPFMLPIGAYLLWTNRSLLLPSLVVLIAHTAVVIGSGWGPEWVARLVGTARSMSEIAGNFGPTRIFGPSWLIAGIPVAVWLARSGRVGLAGLAMSPYILATYYLMALVDWPRRSTARAS